MKSPHSIILPTFLKSVSVAWRNKNTMMKRESYMGKEEKTLHSKRWTGERGGKKSKGRRVMEIGREWASKVPGGHF